MAFVFFVQLNQKSDQLQLLQQTLDDKRVELLKAEAKLRETEEKYYSSAANINDKVRDDLRVRHFQQEITQIVIRSLDGTSNCLRSPAVDFWSSGKADGLIYRSASGFLLCCLLIVFRLSATVWLKFERGTVWTPICGVWRESTGWDW